MNTTISIEQETMLKGHWLRIYIPVDTSQMAMATIENTTGSLIRKINLFPGNNSIDISHISEKAINIKIETAFETILKEIKIT